MLYVSIGRRLVIIANGSVIWTLALLTLAPYPQQEARDSQNTAQDQPKTARKRPKRRPQGPKRAPRRAQKGPKKGPRRPRRASGRPKREHPRIGPQPIVSCSKTGPVLACLGVRFGAQVGPQIVQNGPRSAPRDGVEMCIFKNTPEEPESQLEEVSGRPPATPKSFKSCVVYYVFEVSSLYAYLGPRSDLKNPRSRF